MIFRRKKTEDAAAPRYLSFNLLPQDYLVRRRRAAFNLLVGILIIAVVVAIGGLTFQQYQILETYQDRTRAAKQELPQYTEALEVEEELATYRTEYEQRKEFMEGAALPIDINVALRDMAESIPDAVRLTQLYVRGEGGIQLTGTADTLYQVSHFASVIRDEVEYMMEPFVTFPATIRTDEPEDPEMEETPPRIIFQMEIPWDMGGDGE